MKVTTTATNLIKKKKRGVKGKIVRKRQKDNTLAQTLKVHAKNIIDPTEVSASASDSIQAKSPANKSNIFAGLNIKLTDLNKSLTSQCVPVTKDSLPKHFPKKEKRKLRHEAFLKKIESVGEVRQNNRKNRRRLKKSGDDDMESQIPTAVLDATPQPAESKRPVKKQKKQKVEKVSNKPIPKMKDRVEQHLRDVQLFKDVMSNSMYKSNPGGAITNFLQKLHESVN